MNSFKSIAQAWRVNTHLLRAHNPKYIKYLGVLLLVITPLIVPEYFVGVVSEALIFAIFALGINFLLGRMGYVSFGHAMFLGMGGYFYGILIVELGYSTWLAALVGIVATFVVGLLIGLICMRVNRVQFILITLAIGEMFRGVFVSARSLGGTDGMAGLPRLSLEWVGIDLNSSMSFYFYIVFIFLLLVAALSRLNKSSFGLSMEGIRENEKRMTSVGYNIAVYKYVAFGISGLITGTAGLLLAQMTYFVSPDTLSWMTSGEGLMAVIIGGSRYLLGPVFGALFYVLFKNIVNLFITEYIIVLGLSFVIIVVLFKDGLYTYFYRIIKKHHDN